MKPRPFAYRRVTSLEEACALLAEHGDNARILAGGQSLVPMMNFRLVSPDLLIDIGLLEALRGISVDAQGLRIGAMARHRQIETDPLVAQHAPLLTLAAAHVAHQAVRNRGTFGGSLCHADPAAEFPACMLVLDAILHVVSASGTRTTAAADFFQGPFSTALRTGEMLVAVTIPVNSARDSFAIHEMTRRHGDLAMAGVVARCDPARRTAQQWAAFGVEDRPVRLMTLESRLREAGPANDAELLAALATDLPSAAGSSAPDRAKLAITAELVRRCQRDLSQSEVR